MKITNALAILVLAVAIAFDPWADWDVQPRFGVSEVLGYARTVRDKLTPMCKKDGFASVKGIAELGVTHQGPSTVVKAAVLKQMGPESVSLTISLGAIHRHYLFTLVRTSPVPEGSTLTFHMTCKEQATAWRLVSTTIEQKYLPASLRSDR